MTEFFVHATTLDRYVLSRPGRLYFVLNVPSLPGRKLQERHVDVVLPFLVHTFRPVGSEMVSLNERLPDSRWRTPTRILFPRQIDVAGTFTRTAASAMEGRTPSAMIATSVAIIRRRGRRTSPSSSAPDATEGQRRERQRRCHEEGGANGRHPEPAKDVPGPGHSERGGADGAVPLDRPALFPGVGVASR